LATITAIRSELEAELAGHRFGKIFQLSKFDSAIDFRLSDSGYLFISIDPADPRVYLINRRLRDLERSSGNPTPFSLTLRKRLSGAVLSAVKQVRGERVLIFAFDAVDDLGRPVEYGLVAQLTGRSANLFLIDSQSRIVEAARQTRGDGQQVGDVYDAPKRSGPAPAPDDRITVPDGRISETLDAEYLERSSERRFELLAASARNKLKQETARHQKLIRKLNEDLAGHGNAEKWKRLGDLLLANASNGRRDGSKIFVTDYFDEAAPEIAIDVDENDSITDAAEKYFKRYTKARNAGNEIENRLREIESGLARLTRKADVIEEAIATRDEDALVAFTGGGNEKPTKKVAAKRSDDLAAARSFASSDGFEILVGKKAKDNDFLTFRMAKSLDTWMHAADYPGSHVVIRNPNRKEIPHRTLLEAAQLAAFYSQGKAQPKAAVHYTQKKFVNKPKGAAPGLVSLASFKTILVEPKIGDVKKSDE
jgi:predicted ribosome quality control (RQC) complex YloA/Tae2 family protein